MSALIGLVLLAAAAQDDPPLVRPAPIRKCLCIPAPPPADAVVFTGVPIDAQMTLDPSGFNAEPRQATIFRVLKVEAGEKTKEAKVWHDADVGNCGIRFDYGKVYRVRARKADDSLETDRCLMKDVEQPPAE